MDKPIQLLPDPPANVEGRAFFVSVIDASGKKYRLALGPYPTHDEAKANVDRGKAMVYEQYPQDACWFGYGTCSMPVEDAEGIVTVFGK